MLVSLNNCLIPEADAAISIADRGFLYGDGLFETVRACDGRLALWEEHARRLFAGAAALSLSVPAGKDELRQRAERLLSANGLANAIVRVTLTRGPGPRGYSTRGADQPTLLVTTQPAPALDPDAAPRARRLRVSSWRLRSDDPLARFKTANRLIHVLARAEAEAAGADEALLLNERDEVAEAAAANVFWLDEKGWKTPPVECGGMAGVTRGFVLRLLAEAGIPHCEAREGAQALRHARGIFLTLSTEGIVPVIGLDECPIPVPGEALELRARYFSRLRHELCH